MLQLSDYSMYFLGFPQMNSTDTRFGSRVGLLQLVHVHDSEDDDSFEVKRGDPVCSTSFPKNGGSLPDLSSFLARAFRISQFLYQM